jgi:hypothetical protein
VAIVQQTPVPPTGFLAGLKAGWHAFLVFGAGLLTVLGAVLPFLALFVLIGLPLVWLVRRRIAAQARPAAPSKESAGEATAS